MLFSNDRDIADTGIPREAETQVSDVVERCHRWGIVWKLDPKKTMFVNKPESKYCFCKQHLLTCRLVPTAHSQRSVKAPLSSIDRLRSSRYTGWYAHRGGRYVIYVGRRMGFRLLYMMMMSAMFGNAVSLTDSVVRGVQCSRSWGDALPKCRTTPVIQTSPAALTGVPPVLGGDNEVMHLLQC